MKIVFQPFISSYSKYHFTASKENKSVNENVDNNKFRNNSLIIAGALCLAGVGIYISKRRPPVKNHYLKNLLQSFRLVIIMKSLNSCF